MIETRACWSVLLGQAHDEVQQAHGALQQARQRVHSLQESRQRLCTLYAEYQRPPAPGAVMQGLQDVVGRRQFAAQLASLQQRLEHDMAAAERAVAQARQRLAAAERQRQKMQALVDQDRHQARQAAARQEQRQFDELGIARFNRGAAA